LSQGQSLSSGDSRHHVNIIICTLSVLLAWAIVIYIVNPVGEFGVNDDWSFVRSLQALEKGRVIPTGWGSGGPSAIVHVLWGGLFTSVGEFSLTKLRLSVLVMGIAGSLGLLLLLLRAGVSAPAALLGAFVAILNPLFLSQAFTFMTDITFAALVVFSLLFFYAGMARNSFALVIAGLIFALAAILTRQIGVVLPAAFVVACYFSSKGKELGWKRIVLAVIFVDLIPWMGFEVFLHFVGSTPVTEHDVITNITHKPMEKGFPGYLGYLFSNLVLAGIGYTAFFVSPLLVAGFSDHLKSKALKCFFVVATAVFVILEIAIWTDFLELPTPLHRNVIFNVGIGPVLLKDTYLMGIQRFPEAPNMLYYLIVYWAALSTAVLARILWRFATGLWKQRGADKDKAGLFIEVFSLVAALFYLGIITFTGFHDRYLIPVIVFVVIWLCRVQFASPRESFGAKQFVAGSLFCCVIGTMSVMAVHDFMEMKRHLAAAQDYVVKELRTQPCDFDGGFEYNGCHCYQKDFEFKSGLSWWWVSREDYVLTLGPLPGYRTVKTFPFKRFIGEDGAIYILQPT